MTDGRRLSDRIVSAHKLACVDNIKTISSLLLEALEIDLSMVGGKHPDRRIRAKQYEEAFDLHQETFGTLKIEPL